MIKTKPLLSLTAADIMTGELTLVPEDMTLPAAARMLSEHQVSGAPVVDRDGKCVGVLSATDYVHWAEKNGVQHRNKDICKAWEIVESSPHQLVRDYMTHDPVKVSSSTPIAVLARKMIDAHIHRVIVVDPNDHPTGIVSSTDILAAVAYAEPSGTICQN